MSKKNKKNNPMNKSKSKSKNEDNRNSKSKSNNEVVARESLTGWKAKSAVVILILEVIVAVLMLVKIFFRSSFTIFNGSKIIWIIYLVIQIILGFTILSRKIDSTKGTFHWESVFITITYVLLP